MAARARRAVGSLAILAFGLVAGGLSLGLAPAAMLPLAGAATCTSSGGVSVVVDYRELGGSTVTACASDGGGKSAAAIFASVGVAIGYATRQPGFVCRVNGVPTSDPCVNASPANAYWGLWWADGSKASWTFSSSGVGALTVPAGGSVGWSWQQDRPSGASVPPSVAPPVSRTATATPSPSPSPTASPTPSSSPSSSPTATPSGGGGSTGGSGGGSQSTSPSPSSGAGSGGSAGSAGASGGSGSSASPQATPSGTPSDRSESPVASESPGDSRTTEAFEAPSLDAESPGDSPASEDAGGADSPSESPGDSGTSTPAEAGAPTAGQPARVPAAVTWGVVGLLAISIAGSAVVARRRRGV